MTDRRKEREKNIFVILTVLLLAAVLSSFLVGAYPLTLPQIGQILTGKLRGTMESRVFYRLRLPRITAAVLAGAVLGVTGAVYQTVFSSPLASPDLTGVASGASLGAACAIVLGSGSIAQRLGLSFIFGLLSLALVLLLVKAAGSERSVTYILAGIIISSIADALLMLLKITADPERELAAIEFWTMGSLGSITANKTLVMAAFAVPSLAALLALQKTAVMLSLGSESARGLGLSPNLWRGLLLFLATLSVSAVVCVTGVIAFLGLIAPHIAMYLYKRRTGGYFAVCALTGAIIMVLSDMLARSVSAGAELPLSIFTVAFAAPVLFLLICRRKDGRI